MNTCPNCGKVAGGQSSILQGCVCQYSMQAPPQPEQEHFALKHRIAELEGAVIGLQAQLAQPKQESVAMADYMALMEKYAFLKAQRTGVKLTDEEIWQIATDCTIGGDLHADKFARAIESRLKELNT